MTAFSDITRLPEFEKDLKKLKKRFPTLDDDLKVFLSVQLPLFHKLNKDNQGIVPIAGLGIDQPKMYKARKFACKALKGRGANTRLRVIYTYFEAEDRVELVEMYFKGDKENEDKGRILKKYSE
ncbi:MAG: hypothetical protein AB1439_07300 [candidate division FCPU426 bacterium]